MAPRKKAQQPLTFDPQNANKGTPRGKELLELSLQEVGAGRSILVDKHGRVIAGNKTLQAWTQLGEGQTEVIHTDGKRLVVVQRDDLDLDDPVGIARKLAYYDNRVQELDLLWDEQQVLKDLDVGLDLGSLWDAEELDALLATLDYPGANPNLSPEFSTRSYTEDDVQHSGEKLNRQFDRTADQVELICPECGETFYMNRGDL